MLKRTRMPFIILSFLAATFASTAAHAIPRGTSRIGLTPPTKASTMIGVANWSANYGGQSSLMMGANDSAALGVQNLMVALGPNYHTLDYPGTDFTAHTSADGVDANGNPNPHAVNSMKDIADSKAFQKVFGMSQFKTYKIDTSPLSVVNPLDPVNPATEYQDVYKEFYDLIAYLMTTYQGTGKKFILTNWEGDNEFMFENQVATHPPVKNQIQNFITEMQARHDALLQARRDFANLSGVSIQDAIEINRVDCAKGQAPRSCSASVVPSTPVCVLRDIVPCVDSDMLSYSSYETLNDGIYAGDLGGEITRDMSMIRNYPGMDGRPLMIGEFGFDGNEDPADPAPIKDPECLGIGDDSAAAVAGCETSIAANAFANSGIPLAFDWEIKDSGNLDKGLGLINSDGTFSPSYRAVQSLLTQSASNMVPIFRNSSGGSTFGGNVSSNRTGVVTANPIRYNPLSNNLISANAPLGSQATLADVQNMAAQTSGHGARVINR